MRKERSASQTQRTGGSGGVGTAVWVWAAAAARRRRPGRRRRPPAAACLCRMSARSVGSSTLLLISAAVAAAAAAVPGSSTSTSTSTPGNPWVGNETVTAELMRLSEWIMTTDVGSNVLKNVSKTDNTSIFINGDLARVLLASSKVARQQQQPSSSSTAQEAFAARRADAYLSEGLRWCDSLVKLQLPIKSGTGAAAGFWNTGYNQIFIADTGTAVTALTLCATMQPDAAKIAQYEVALGKFALFVTEGCASPPTTICTTPPFPGCKSNLTKLMGPHSACPQGKDGWVITSGKDKGGLGDGWCAYYTLHSPLPTRASHTPRVTCWQPSFS
jgi:hypothetical protein